MMIGMRMTPPQNLINAIRSMRLRPLVDPTAAPSTVRDDHDAEIKILLFRTLVPEKWYAWDLDQLPEGVKPDLRALLPPGANAMRDFVVRNADDFAHKTSSFKLRGPEGGGPRLQLDEPCHPELSVTASIPDNALFLPALPPTQATCAIYLAVAAVT